MTEMVENLTIEYIPLENITPYENNARSHGHEDVNAIKESIKMFGMNDPIGVWSDKNIIVEGHGRLLALKELGYKEAPCLRLDRLTDEERKAYALAHNKTAELSKWDFDMLNTELENLKVDNIDMGVFQFDDLVKVDEEKFSEVPEVFEDTVIQEDISEGVDCIMPPLSVLNCGYRKWSARKKEWKKYGIKSEIGRDSNLLGDGLTKMAKAAGSDTLKGTSVFDPALCEVMYKWFNIEGGTIYDCFAGGSVRGIVASKLGYEYIGIDVRQEQVDANIENAIQIGVSPVWICDDSLNADYYIEDNSVDMIFSCPPYADLEVYSDNPKDLSNMEYSEFIRVYREIINISCRKLKENRFAVFIVGDVRDKQGFYRDFIGETKKAFKDSGLYLYNDIIYREAGGTHALRAANQFNSFRKVVKTHQNILVFYKGVISTISSTFPKLDTSTSISEWMKVQEEKRRKEFR